MQILLLMAVCAAVGFMAGMVVKEAIETYKVMVGNIKRYKLLKLLNKEKSGIVFGLNQHGKLWVEVKRNGKTLETYQIVPQLYYN